ncbi:MAG TPA: wax ester/triacylglycerol synthase family O-acyltransferase [Solirubrobacterales bacterium]|nr:wax ester/triacylglycerol synthase family O-acyltransferase [Solirubrobacterales bacterium]
MGEELTALDATFLQLEEADQSAHMHIGGVILIEPGPDGSPPHIERIREDVLARLPDVPRFTERLSAPHTGGLHWPEWQPDPDFDIARHVFEAGLPAPGGRRELVGWAGDFYSQRLDRTRPLWELAIVTLADGRWAIATKTHHCMVDGVGSVDIGTTLLDTQPEQRHPDGGGWTAAAADGASGEGPPDWRGAAFRLARPGLALARAVLRAGEAGVHAAEAAIGATAHPQRARDALHRARALAEVLVFDELIAAPHTSLNEPIGTKRRLAVFSVELDDLRRVRGALGGTVNDVVLAASAGGLRALLNARGEELPAQGLRAMVPMNIRSAAEQLALGNRISSLFIHLPVAARDPLERYRQQLQEAETLKASAQALGTTTILDLADRLPPVLHSFVARSLYATRLFNVTVTNVPGPQTPLYCFGSRVQEIWPLVPIAAEHAVGLAVFSYMGRLYFCVNADRDSVPDINVLADGIEGSLAELCELAQGPQEDG